MSITIETAASPGERGPAIVDLTDPESFAVDVPHAAFAAIRERPGLYWQPTTLGVANGGFWAVARFADIVAVERDPTTFSSSQGGAYPMTNQNPRSAEARTHLMMSDPPQHSRLRRAAAKGFSPRVVANFEPWVREIVREVLDCVEGKQEFDYVIEFARTIPGLVLARVLGIPDENRDALVSWAINVFDVMEPTEGLAEGQGMSEVVHAENFKMADFALRLQAAKRARPADDMFTQLGACVDNGELSQEEFLNWVLLMMAAGFETTHTAIGQSMRMYLENPEIAIATDRAIGDGLIDRVVDEYLRLITPPMQMARTATRDVAFAGEHVREGDVMVMYFIAGNRDPAVFSEPDRFNPWRTETETLAFGSGVHRCIGAHLAKLEVRILWEELRARRVMLRLKGQPRRGRSIFINQLKALPVRRV